MSDPTRQTPGAKTSHGALWSAADLWTQQLTQLLTFVLVGNILGPAVVGVMTMAMLVTLFLATFLENGFTDALIQKDGLRKEHIDSALWLMIGFGGIEALALWAASPLVASFFKTPQLAEILPLMGIALPFIGVTACYGAVLQRQLKFKQLATRSILAYGIAFVIAYALARTGHGVYSLVGYFVVARFIDAALVVAISGIRPQFIVTREAVRHIVDYGKHRVAHQAVTYVTAQLDRLVIGFFLGPHALGLYAVAERLVGALIVGVSGVFQRVAFPVLSSRQNDRASFDIALRDFFTATNIVSFPIFAGLALTSAPLIRLMFSPEWDGVIPIMMVLCAVGLTHPSNYVLTGATNALGHPRSVLWVGILVFIMRFVATFSSAQFGVFAVACANAGVYLLSLPVFLFVVRDLYRRGWLYYFSESGRAALASLAMAAVVWVIGLETHALPPLMALAIDVIAGVSTYIVALRLIAPDLFGKALHVVTSRA